MPECEENIPTVSDFSFTSEVLEWLVITGIIVDDFNRIVKEKTIDFTNLYAINLCDEYDARLVGEFIANLWYFRVPFFWPL